MFWVIVGLDVDSAVWRQLSGVYENSGSDCMILSRQAVNRLDEASDVRRSTHGKDRDTLAVFREQPVHVILVESPIARHLRSNHLNAAAPWQVVRVMLHHCRKNHAIRAQRIAERELVNRFGRVLPKDDRVGAHVGSDEMTY